MVVVYGRLYVVMQEDADSAFFCREGWSWRGYPALAFQSEVVVH
jgi:hypothetical protein